MAIGPVEYIIVGFPGNKFNGEIAPELGKLVESGTIRILDLVFITKDADGDVAGVEFEDHDDVALFNALEGEVGGLISRGGRRVRRRRARAELVGRAADLGGRLGDAVRRGDAQLGWRADRGLPHPPRPDRGRRGRAGRGRLTHHIRPIHKHKENDMLRRRPVARAAVTTSVVVGTADPDEEPRRAPPGPPRPLTGDVTERR